jgi:phospholipase C
MKRRTFVKTAGVAAGALLSGQKAGQANPSSVPIQHIVVMMMENRSFDHILGWLPGADGMQAGLTYNDSNGNPQSTFELSPDYTGCAYPDPDHSYDGGRTEYDNGLMDGFLQVQPGSLYPIGYYQETDLPFRSALARNYLTCDRYFPSILAPTFPNRIFQLAGQTDRLTDSLTFCTLPTIWDNLAAAGVSHKYYFNSVPFVALWGTKYLNISHLYSDFLSDCAAGTLPAVSFVDPSFTLLLNLAEDDHPHSDVRNGDAFMAKTFHAITQSPNWPSTALIINYDEWGGFFDHIVPPRATAPNNVDTDLVDGEALLGIRVPCIVVSPWTLAEPNVPNVNSTVFDHTSVLKLIETVFGVPPLAAREESDTVGNLLEVFNFSAPNTDVPALPSPSYVVPSSLCSSSTSPSSRTDSESTIFQQMIDTGMLKGWPGN